jgi:hypothetical protein
MCQHASQLNALKGDDLPNIILGKLDAAVTASTVTCAVGQFVILVLFSGLPAQVSRRYAALVAFAARMRRLMIGSGGRPVHEFTDVSACNLHLAVDVDRSVPK